MDIMTGIWGGAYVNTAQNSDKVWAIAWGITGIGITSALQFERRGMYPYWTLRIWGRRGTRLQKSVQRHSREVDAFASVNGLVKEKMEKGYLTVNPWMLGGYGIVDVLIGLGIVDRIGPGSTYPTIGFTPDGNAVAVLDGPPQPSQPSPPALTPEVIGWISGLVATDGKISAIKALIGWAGGPNVAGVSLAWAKAQVDGIISGRIVAPDVSLTRTTTRSAPIKDIFEKGAETLWTIIEYQTRIDLQTVLGDALDAAVEAEITVSGRTGISMGLVLAHAGSYSTAVKDAIDRLLKTLSARPDPTSEGGISYVVRDQSAFEKALALLREARAEELAVKRRSDPRKRRDLDIAPGEGAESSFRKRRNL